MEESTRNDIRKLLKLFGVQADEAISNHLERNPGGGPLHLRITLEDLTDYGGSPPQEKLHLEIERQVRRRNNLRIDT
jgi:hypothetical protein